MAGQRPFPTPRAAIGELGGASAERLTGKGDFIWVGWAWPTVFSEEWWAMPTHPCEHAESPVRLMGHNSL